MSHVDFSSLTTSRPLAWIGRKAVDKRRRRQSMNKGDGSIMFESRHWSKRECLDSNISALVAIIIPVDSRNMRLDQINGAEAESVIGLKIAPLHHELWSRASIGRFPNHGLIYVNHIDNSSLTTFITLPCIPRNAVNKERRRHCMNKGGGSIMFESS